MSRVRPTTTAWGIFLVLTGGVILLVSTGTRFNILTMTITGLTLLGVTALALALLPRPRARAEVTITRLAPEHPVEGDLATEVLGAYDAPPADATSTSDPVTEVLDGTSTQVLSEQAPPPGTPSI